MVVPRSPAAPPSERPAGARHYGWPPPSLGARIWELPPSPPPLPDPTGREGWLPLVAAVEDGRPTDQFLWASAYRPVTLLWQIPLVANISTRSPPPLFFPSSSLSRRGGRPPDAAAENVPRFAAAPRREPAPPPPSPRACTTSPPPTWVVRPTNAAYRVPTPTASSRLPASSRYRHTKRDAGADGVESATSTAQIATLTASPATFRPSPRPASRTLPLQISPRGSHPLSLPRPPGHGAPSPTRFCTPLCFHLSHRPPRILLSPPSPPPPPRRHYMPALPQLHHLPPRPSQRGQGDHHARYCLDVIRSLPARVLPHTEFSPAHSGWHAHPTRPAPPPLSSPPCPSPPHPELPHRQSPLAWLP